MRLLEAAPAHLDWLVGEAPAPAQLSVPPGGVETPEALRRLRAARRGGARSWLMVAAGGEVVGLCGIKGAPRAGTVEIGYAVAPRRRGRGHASRAVPLLLAILREQGIARAAAETEAGNRASERVLARAGFRLAGRREAPGGAVAIWWRPL